MEKDNKCTLCLDSNCTRLFEEEECPKWETLGRTVLISKKGKPLEKAEHFRPITYLSVIYKIQTAIINNILMDHIVRNKIWPFEQLGTLEGTLGEKEAILFNRYIAKEVKLYRRNLTVAWTDVKKVYDSSYQEFIVQILEYLKAPGWIITWLRKAMSTWRTILQVTKGKEKILSKEIFIERGNFQEDLLSPTLFGLAFILISYTIRQMKHGYIPGPPGNRNSNQMETHGLLMNDLKVYSTSHQQLEKVIQQAAYEMEKTGLNLGLDKCSVLTIKAGKECTTKSVKITDEKIIERLKEGKFFEYLGMLQGQIVKTK